MKATTFMSAYMRVLLRYLIYIRKSSSGWFDAKDYGIFTKCCVILSNINLV